MLDGWEGALIYNNSLSSIIIIDLEALYPL